MHAQADAVVAEAQAEPVLARFWSAPARLNAMDARYYTAPIAVIAGYLTVETDAHC